jgi:hypothetical protein
MLSSFKAWYWKNTKLGTGISVKYSEKLGKLTVLCPCSGFLDVKLLFHFLRNECEISHARYLGTATGGYSPRHTEKGSRLVHVVTANILTDSRKPKRRWCAWTNKLEEVQLGTGWMVKKGMCNCPFVCNVKLQLLHKVVHR